MQLKYFITTLLILSINATTAEITCSTFDLHSSLECNPNFNPDINTNKIKWSILIPTIEDRKILFQQLYTELISQITTLNLTDQIEIIYFRDKYGENLIGLKRNILLEKSLGEYVCFIDDDDWISANYISLIYNKLLQNPDCVSLNGIITTNGKDPRKFVHSIKYDSWFTGKDQVYYRPPNHLNPIKRAIAIQFKFPLKNHGEDADWSMQICKSKLIKIEAEVLEPYYFYLFGRTH